MKRIIIYGLVFVCIVLAWGFSSRWGQDELWIPFTFKKSVTIDSTLTVKKGVTFYDTTRYIDGFGGADTNWIVNNGSQLSIAGDNSIRLMDRYDVSITGIGETGDTARYLGYYNHRWNELHALRHCWSSPDKSDSCTQYYDASGVFHIKTDSSSIAANAPDQTLIHGELGGSAFIRGTDTFGAEKTTDTVLVAGTAVASVVVATPKVAAITGQLGVRCAIDTIFVLCVAADTAAMRANGYNWIKIE